MERKRESYPHVVEIASSEQYRPDDGRKINIQSDE